MTVTVSIWLEHERHGHLDYSDEQQVREQLEQARQAVLRYKDHPALLLWVVGNEMELYASGDDPRIWSAVNDVAQMIKELDPYHPTMTVTAEHRLFAYAADPAGHAATAKLPLLVKGKP